MVKEIEKSTGIPTQLAKFLAPGLSLVAKAFFALDFELITPVRAVRELAPRPILFIHGGKDDVIPSAHSYRLNDASDNPTNELWIIPGLGHTEAVRPLGQGCETTTVSAIRDSYLERVTTFFDRHLR